MGIGPVGLQPFLLQDWGRVARHPGVGREQSLDVPLHYLTSVPL